MMKKLKKFRCGLFVLSFVVLSIGLFLSFSDNTHAAAEWNALECPAASTTVPDLDFDWTTLLKERFETQHPTETYPGLTGNAVYMMGQYTQDSAQMRIVFLLDNNDEIVFRKSDPPTNEYEAFITPGSRYVQYGINGTNMPGTFPATIQLGTPIQTAHPTNGVVFTGFYCHEGSRGITYDSSWDLDDYGQYNPDPEIQCDTWDIPCHISKIGEKIGGAFTGIVEGIITALTWLFVPDPDYIQPLIENLQDTLQDRLGILWIPFDLLVAFLQVFIAGNPENWNQPNHLYCHGSPTATLFGHSVKIYDFIPYCKVILNSGPPTGYDITPVYPLVELVMNFFRMAFFLAVCSLFYHKVKELLHK